MADEAGHRPEAQIEPAEPAPGGVDAIEEPDERPVPPDLPLLGNAAPDEDVPDELSEPEDTDQGASTDGTPDPEKGESRMSDPDEQRPDGGHAADTELADSNPNGGGPQRAAGQMGVSSERVGPTGPGQESTDGERDTTEPGHLDHDDDPVGSDG